MSLFAPRCYQRHHPAGAGTSQLSQHQRWKRQVQDRSMTWPASVSMCEIMESCIGHDSFACASYAPAFSQMENEGLSVQIHLWFHSSYLSHQSSARNFHIGTRYPSFAVSLDLCLVNFAMMSRMLSMKQFPALTLLRRVATKYRIPKLPPNYITNWH